MKKKINSFIRQEGCQNLSVKGIMSDMTKLRSVDVPEIYEFLCQNSLAS